MLEAIADFWKPVKRLQAQMRLKPEELQIGSNIGFGFVPQPSLSGRRLTITAINTYKFGPDVLTSFVLSQDKDAGASMIIAETGGEQYIAVSRRISISDRNKIFDHDDIEAVIKEDDRQMIHCKEIITDYKGWLAPHYKREIKSVKGQLYKGDHRGGIMTGQEAMEFSYTLMVSDNNEHALEIEHYEDGRIEVYATVYRRMSDVGEVNNPSKKENGAAAPARPEMKIASNENTVAAPAPAKPAPKMGDGLSAPAVKETVNLESKKTEAPVEIAKPVEAPKVAVEEKAVTEPVKLKELPAEAVVKKEEVPKPENPSEKSKVEEPKKEIPKHAEAPKQEAPEVKTQSSWPAAKPVTMGATEPKQTTTTESKTAIVVQPTSQPYIKQEIKAVNNDTSNFVNESIDCELSVANKIIDEAIRNEMRINDVVRRVIGLPVSAQESVQIPVTLTDQDYALLAIRYGISNSDRESIKKRIIEDLGDFSGANKQRKAA